ncbi:cytochrome p450 domain-containing protein [Phthorimaea operculella]|nr:cytochrome p450 domain-containing protein [Phthorimaea operculella]
MEDGVLKRTLRKTVSIAYVNDTIASCAFGLDVNSFKNPKNFIFQLCKKAVLEDSTQLLKFFWCENSKTLLKLLNVKIIKTEYAEKISQLFKSVLNTRRKHYENRADIVQLLIDGKNKYNNNVSNSSGKSEERYLIDEDLVAQAVVFFSAGFDTTATFINYFCAQMAANPHIQERVQAELDTINDEENLFDQIQGLEYLDMCINEVLRLFPPLGFTSRRSNVPYDFGPTQYGGQKHFMAPAGMHIWIPIHAIHHDEKYWPNPDKFDPERFSPENKDKIVPFSYMPFGLGPRNCIGDRFAILAGKVFLVELLKNFNLRAPKTLNHSFKPNFFVLRPSDGFSNITIEPRKLEQTKTF